MAYTIVTAVTLNRKIPRPALTATHKTVLKVTRSEMLKGGLLSNLILHSKSYTIVFQLALQDFPDVVLLYRQFVYTISSRQSFITL